MENNALRSIALSRTLLRLFALALAVLDWAIWPLTTLFREKLPLFNQTDTYLLIACLYLCNAPGFLLLWFMEKLLKNLRDGRVFVEDNVSLLRRIAHCCYAACLLCLALCPRIYLLGFVAVAAGFMGLVVRIVRNVFVQAIPMRDELDLTV